MLNPHKDGVEGTSTLRLRKHLKFPKAVAPITVAVIDTGVDINHPAFNGKLWVNSRETNGAPGVDDDHNGIVDDIHGWNLLGKRSGENALYLTKSTVRVVKNLQSKDPLDLTPVEQTALKEALEDVTAFRATAENEYAKFKSGLDAITLLKSHGLTSESTSALQELNVDSPDVASAKIKAHSLFEQGMTSDFLMALMPFSKLELDYHLNLDFDETKAIDEAGNNDIVGPNASHGTCVAGVIATLADAVRIMPIRAVPVGDERDVDIARAIRYAVDHGARIINMSFAKRISEERELVQEALSYAAAHDVLLVHGSGNSGMNLDLPAVRSYPSPKLNGNQRDPRLANHWIEVGGSNRMHGENLIASSSNYGKLSVDIFAPSEKIQAPTLGNQIEEVGGTSLAAPQVTGVAALLWSRFPNAPASKIRNAILKSARRYPELGVVPPAADSSKLVPLESLSATGGLLDAYEAMKHLIREQ